MCMCVCKCVFETVCVCVYAHVNMHVYVCDYIAMQVIFKISATEFFTQFSTQVS